MKQLLYILLVVIVMSGCSDLKESHYKNHVSAALPEIGISSDNRFYTDLSTGKPAEGNFTSNRDNGDMVADISFFGGMILTGEIHLSPEMEKYGWFDSEDVKWIYSESNGVHSEKLYIDGVFVQQVDIRENLLNFTSIKRWRPDGTPEYALTENYIREWFPDGTLKSEAQLGDDWVEGRVALWHENGQIAGESFYKNGELDGDYLEWDRNGNLITEKKYEMGELVYRRD